MRKFFVFSSIIALFFLQIQVARSQTTTKPQISERIAKDSSQSGNFIQNTTERQPSSNFNISGNGEAGGTLSATSVNAAWQYNLGGTRFLSNPGMNNLFAGVGTGISNSSGFQNTFVGAGAGLSNTTGSNNTFVGKSAGSANSTSSRNAFVGAFAGETNSIGSDNSFFGESAGKFNTTGAGNSFFGRGAGLFNTTGHKNSFFGEGAGISNSEGTDNSFFGSEAGNQNTASGNSFFGFSAGAANSTGAGNSFFGKEAGRANTTGFSNSIFGSRAGDSNTIGSRNAFFGLASGGLNTDGYQNAFFGTEAGAVNTIGHDNAFFGENSGRLTTSGSNNTFIGTFAGDRNTTGSFNTAIGADASTGDRDFSFATAIGAGAVAPASNNITLGRPGGEDLVRLPGSLLLHTLSTGGITQLCRNSILVVSTCSSSARYKSNIHNFAPGLDLIQKLRPVAFNWKEGGMLDLGLIAEDVFKVEPLLTTANAKGEVEGVKYDRIGVVAVNAIKEQQLEIESLRVDNANLSREVVDLRNTMKFQRDELKALKAIACSIRPRTATCRQELIRRRKTNSAHR